MNRVARATALAIACAALAALCALACAWSVDEIQRGSFEDLGATGKAVAGALVVFLVLLACRHLVMLALALWHYVRDAEPHERGAGTLPFVSIIVPAFNEAPMIRSVLESLLAVRYSRFEVIVVDDGSSDQTFLRAYPFQRRRPDVEFRVLAKPNGGKFDALNHGIAHARGEIVVCIDGDSMLHADALQYLVRHFEDARIGAVAGHVRVANRATAWSALQSLEYIVGFGLIKRAQSAAGVVTIVPGPLGAFRKNALSQVNGYDGDTFAEDFDLTMKLLAAGWHVVYEPRACVATEAPERMMELLRQRYRWTRGSLQVLLKRKHRLLTPVRHPLRFLGMAYLMLEYLAWPALHVGAQLLFVAAGLLVGTQLVVACWWLQLISLEAAVVAFCIAVEHESIVLLALSPLFRIFYLIVLDVARLFAALDEFGRVRMGWESVARLGTLKALVRSGA